jgi:hypothetical protein
MPFFIFIWTIIYRILPIIFSDFVHFTAQFQQKNTCFIDKDLLRQQKSGKALLSVAAVLGSYASLKLRSTAWQILHKFP